MDAKARSNPHQTAKSEPEDHVLAIVSEDFGARSVYATRTFEGFGNELLGRFALAMELEPASGLASPDSAIVRFARSTALSDASRPTSAGTDRNHAISSPTNGRRVP